MKKLVLSVAFIALLSISFTSCRETKEEKQDTVENTDATTNNIENTGNVKMLHVTLGYRTRQRLEQQRKCNATVQMTSRHSGNRRQRHSSNEQQHKSRRFG